MLLLLLLLLLATSSPQQQQAGLSLEIYNNTRTASAPHQEPGRQIRRALGPGTRRAQCFSIQWTSATNTTNASAAAGGEDSSVAVLASV